MIISVFNQKGIVGKTSTTLSLGLALVEAGHRVLLCDLDLQRDLMTYEETVDIPQTKFAATDADDLPAVLKAGGFDFALLACPPSLGDETCSYRGRVRRRAGDRARVIEVIRAAEVTNPL